MAAVVFSQMPRVGKTQRLTARFDALGSTLPRRPQFSASDMLRARPGPEATWPVGTDTNTPGYPREQRRNPGHLVRHD